jgi:hypothetical protein
MARALEGTSPYLAQTKKILADFPEIRAKIVDQHAVDFNISCHLFQQSMSYQHWGVGTEPPRLGVSHYPRRLMSASAGSFENAFSTRMLARSRSATFDVGAFPICSHTTFGGAPRTRARLRKSSSFDTSVNP